MEEQTKTYERLDSIEISMTSKGAYSFKIKRYYDYSQDDPELVIKSIKKMHDNLRQTFPSQ